MLITNIEFQDESVTESPPESPPESSPNPKNPPEDMWLYVNSTSGDGLNDGTQLSPLKTIAAAISLASITDKNHIAVCAGIYDEHKLTLSDNISLYGSYDCSTLD